MAVYNRFKILLAQKETQEGRRISYKEIQQATGVAASSLSAWATNAIDRYDRSTIDRLCAYFECDIQDLLVYSPAGAQSAAIPKTGEDDSDSSGMASALESEEDPASEEGSTEPTDSSEEQTP